MYGKDRFHTSWKNSITGKDQKVSVKFRALMEGDGIVECCLDNVVMSVSYNKMRSEQLEDYGFASCNLQDFDTSKMSRDELD